MEILEQKQEIIDWVLSLQNKDILNDIYRLKKQTTRFNFDEEFAKGITSKELKEKTTAFLKSLPWKE